MLITAVKQFSKYLIKIVDSNAIVIAVIVFDKLNGVQQLLIEFEKKTNSEIHTNSLNR